MSRIHLADPRRRRGCCRLLGGNASWSVAVPSRVRQSGVTWPVLRRSASVDRKWTGLVTVRRQSSLHRAHCRVFWRRSLYRPTSTRGLYIASKASRCRRAFILPLSFCDFFFFFRRLISEVTERISVKLGHHSLMTAIWKIWSELSGHLPSRAGGKKRFLVPTSNFDRKSLRNETWYQQSERNLSIYRDSVHAPKFGDLWSRKGWERLASFCTPLNFRIGRHCQPYRMDVI